MVKYTSVSEKLFDALGQPTRRNIIDFLSRNGEVILSDLAEYCDVSLPAAQKQVRILENSGLVQCRKEGRVLLCSINTEAFNQMIDWLLARQQFWSKSFDKLDRHLKQNKERK